MNANAKAWVAALRSGRYKQGRSVLCAKTPNGEERWCCLGVACVLYNDAMERKGRPTLSFTELTDGICIENHWGTLPNKVRDWLALTTRVGSFTGPEARSVKDSIGDATLAGLNDYLNYSFDQIADFIETEPEGLFLAEEEG